MFRSGVKTKLKFRCEQCLVRKGKKGKEVARGWTSINGTTMMFYKVDVPRKRIYLAVLVFLQRCFRCKETGSVRLYDDETARVCSDFSQQIEIEITGRVFNPIERAPRASNAKNRHRSDLCLAC